MNGNGSRSVGDAFRSSHQRLDPVGDILRRFSESRSLKLIAALQWPTSPIGRLRGDIAISPSRAYSDRGGVGPGMQPPGQRTVSRGSRTSAHPGRGLPRGFIESVGLPEVLLPGAACREAGRRVAGKRATTSGPMAWPLPSHRSACLVDPRLETHPVKMLEAEFQRAVSDYLKRYAMSGRKLGELALGDPGFVPDLKRGASPCLGAVDRVLRFLDIAPSVQGSGGRSRRSSSSTGQGRPWSGPGPSGNPRSCGSSEAGRRQRSTASSG